jgi:cysteine-rich repeat protein
MQHVGDEQADCAASAVAVCGNGRRETGEQCDDGNRQSGDGCDRRCDDEPGWRDFHRLARRLAGALTQTSDSTRGSRASVLMATLPPSEKATSPILL